jgi:geranylgeranyl diphosphate synthase type I
MASVDRDGALPTSFGAFARVVKDEVDTRLAGMARAETARAERVSPEVARVVGALFDVATRGGKRVRPAIVCAANAACGGDAMSHAIIEAGVALEVLHAYLLIHDDWMDGDDVRRGGPSAHVALREAYDSSRAGEAGAILAGDFGQAFAFEALASIDAPSDRVVLAVREVSRMLAEVVSGQVLDVRAAAKTRAEVETMHRLKTSSYTTRTPLVLGAIFAGADEKTRESLRDAGDPLGVAFQLRDDLLGTFGDPTLTGKSVRSDLRSGKRTALVAELEDDRGARQILPRVLGVEDAPDEEVDALIARMIEGGAKARVEARLAALLGESRARIEALALTREGKTLLLGAIDALGTRES